MNDDGRRYAFAGIIIEDRRKSAASVQTVLSEYADCISGRMGIPHLEGRDISVITLILHVTTDELGALSGKIGRIPGDSIKTGISKSRYECISQGENNDER